ncbi:MAG: response regulator [Candidatus Aminicenantes bacterium]|jgi:DNA-binding response OmpR family regulator
MDIPQLKRIMYVDDDPDLQDIVRLGLETRAGFTVTCCDSGNQALEEIRDFKPDLVILDMVLPGMSGLHLLERMRELRGVPWIPVIFLTSKISPQQVEEYKELGVIGVINKPLNPLELRDRVRDIWEGSPG